jgi:phosphoglycerate dehydrogenase-like enzyme
MTNSSSVYDEPCAQHLLAFMLAIARQLPGCLADQQPARSWAYGAHRPATRILKSDTVLILGYGAIGRRLAELLSPFGVSVIGVRRVVRGDESIPTYPLTHLEALLPKADHVVNILPANPSTNGLIGPSFLGQVKPGALFYNVGRGTTVDQMALISALESGQLGGAYLDVTDPEPLPSDHPLWTCRNCYITPHIAGGRQAEDSTLVSHFLDNLRRYLATEPLTDRII